jgi:hypothetical protein
MATIDVFSRYVVGSVVANGANGSLRNTCGKQAINPWKLTDSCEPGFLQISRRNPRNSTSISKPLGQRRLQRHLLA